MCLPAQSGLEAPAAELQVELHWKQAAISEVPCRSVKEPTVWAKAQRCPLCA